MFYVTLRPAYRLKSRCVTTVVNVYNLLFEISAGPVYFSLGLNTKQLILYNNVEFKIFKRHLVHL